MKWTADDRAKLLEIKDVIDFDDIKIKEQIKRVLLQNRYIIHVLHNKALEDADAEPEDYFYDCILPYYMVKPTQSESKNFLCFEINYDEIDKYNSCMKKLEIVFHILCHHHDLNDKETGLARHDLLAALIQDQFNYTNIFGNKIKLVSDVASTVDMDYATRTLIFQQYADNNVIKTRNNVPRFANKDLIVLAEES